MDTLLAWIGILAALVALTILVIILLGMMKYGPMAPFIWDYHGHYGGHHA